MLGLIVAGCAKDEYSKLKFPTPWVNGHRFGTRQQYENYTKLQRELAREVAAPSESEYDTQPTFIPLAPEMTKEDATAKWGFPRRINKTETIRGVSEQWVYEDFGRYLYFENGKITTIQTSD